MFTIERIPAARNRVRATRIGYESWRSEAFEIEGPVARRTLDVPVARVPLSDLAVTEGSDCPTPREERERAFHLYQDVTPGLEAIQAGDTTEAHRFAVRLVLPEVYWKHTRRLRSDTITRVVDRPMATRSPDELAPTSP